MAQEMNGNQIFAVGLEAITNDRDFRSEVKNLTDQAFADLFRAHAQGNLKWMRSGEDMNDLITEVVARNALNQAIKVTAYLTSQIDSNGHRSASLSLGSKEKAPCRNDNDPRVKALFVELTGLRWNVFCR